MRGAAPWRAAIRDTLDHTTDVEVSLPPSHLFGRVQAARRAALDEDTFAAAWTQGAAMTVEEAIAYGLAPAGSTVGPTAGIVAGVDSTSA